MRRNPPTLVDPIDTVRTVTDRQLGIHSRQALEQRIAAVERLVSGLNRTASATPQPVWSDAEGMESPGPPTIVRQAAAGSTATVTIIGNDDDGMIQIVPGGAGIATGVIAIVTFSLSRRGTNYSIALQEFSAAARTAGSLVGPTNRSTASWQITTGTALSSGSTYQWFYRVRDY